MKSSSKKKILILIICILLIIVGALFYRINYSHMTLKYNTSAYYKWTPVPDSRLVEKYDEFTNGNYNKTNIFKDKNTYNEFIEEYELEELQLLHDFDNYNYVIVMFYVSYGEIIYDGNFNAKTKEIEFTLNTFKDSDYYITDNYDSYYKFFEIELPKNIDNIIVKYKKENMMKDIDPYKTYVEKPIMYIYPEDDMDLTIKLGNNNLITHSYPKYNNEWNIHVDKTGNIYDYKTKRNYYALYWEGNDNTKLDMSEGFVVEGRDTTKFLEEKLEILGLNEKEIEEFIIYWLPRIEDNNYNFIRFRTKEEINNYMPLEFSKNPDTLIRVMVDFKPLDKKIKVKEQVLEKKERKGFTIVEWGGRIND